QSRAALGPWPGFNSNHYSSALSPAISPCRLGTDEVFEADDPAQSPPGANRTVAALVDAHRHHFAVGVSRGPAGDSFARPGPVARREQPHEPDCGARRLAEHGIKRQRSDGVRSRRWPGDTTGARG